MMGNISGDFRMQGFVPIGDSFPPHFTILKEAPFKVLLHHSSLSVSSEDYTLVLMSAPSIIVMKHFIIYFNRSWDYDPVSFFTLFHFLLSKFLIYYLLVCISILFIMLLLIQGGRGA